MMDLDTRARNAADGLRRSVAESNLTLTEPRSVRPSRGWNPAWAMAAGAMTALVLIFGVWSLRPTVVADDLATTTTTIQVTTTTAPVTTTVPTETSVAPAPAPAAPVPTAPVVFITIAAPTDGQVFTESRITFSGTTVPGARVLGGPYEATVDATGSWSILLILSEGSNTATFTAFDAAGNEASASVTAVYQPIKQPVTEPVKEPVKELAQFTAYAVSTETSGDPAYGEYYGTGQPGSLVRAVSDWGSGETVVKADGTWYLKATFKNAPIGTQFEVKVKDEFGRYVYFPMTRTS